MLFLRQGATDQQTADFTEIFEETWRQVPQPQRKKILERGCGKPPVFLGSVYGVTTGVSPLAAADPLFFYAPMIVNLPGGKPWTMAVIAEELAHSFLIADEDPTHIRPGRWKAMSDVEKRAWNDAREKRVVEFLGGWDWVDMDAHAALLAWLHVTFKIQ
jgi:hypothetical protein